MGFYNKSCSSFWTKLKEGFGLKLSLNDMKKYVKNYKKITAVIIVVLLLVMGYTAFKFNQQPNTPNGQNIAQAEVTRGSIEVTVTGTGTITPVAVEDIGPNAAGTVKKLYVKNGDRVKKGDLLLELTNDSLKLQLENARLDADKARLNLEDATGQLTADTITAPFSGRIVDLDVKTGDEVTKNAVLATLQDDSQLVFDMPVESAVAQKVVVGQKVEVFMPDRGETVEGKVIAINSQPVSGYNGQNRTYLKVAVAATGNLSSGIKAFGTLTVDGKQADALAVSTLEWIGESQIKATLTGKITGVYVQEGQAVKKGQRLLAFGNGTALNQQKTLQLSYQQAQLNLTELESQLDDLIVKAPVEGIVSGMDIKEGDEITANGTKSAATAGTSGGNSSSSAASNGTTSSLTKSLGKIINTKQMEISFPVDEVDIAKVKLGQKANVTVDALPDKIFRGTVTEIAEEGTVTNNVSSFDVTILLDNPEGLLKSGMTANVTIVVAKKENALLIPIEALQERGQRKFVLLPGSTDSLQRPNMQPVTVGLTNESYAEISEGLEEGSKVLLPGQQANANRSNAMMPGFGGGPMGGGRFPGSGGGGRTFSGGGGFGGGR